MSDNPGDSKSIDHTPASSPVREGHRQGDELSQDLDSADGFGLANTSYKKMKVGKANVEGDRVDAQSTVEDDGVNEGAHSDGTGWDDAVERDTVSDVSLMVGRSAAKRPYDTSARDATRTKRLRFS